MADNILLKSAKKENNNWPGLFPWIGESFTDSVGLIVQGLWLVIGFLFGPQNRQETSGNDSLYLKATIISVCLSLFLAGISFYGSFAAASSYAEAHGIAREVSSWIPIAIDGFVLLGVLVVFGASLVGDQVGWVRFLIFAFAVVSVIFNVAHILEANGSKDLQAQHVLLGAIFPLIVFLASEVTSKQISAYIERKSGLVTNQALAAEIETRIEEKRGLLDEVETKRRAMLAEAEAEIKAELETLESRRDSLIAEIEQGQRKLRRLQDEVENTVNYDEIDLQITYMLGADPGISGQKVGDFYDKSATWGNERKKKVSKSLNGVTEYVG